MYVIVAIVTYCYAGIDVASPALGSTSPLLQKIAYGVALPTIVIAGMYIQRPIFIIRTTFKAAKYIPQPEGSFKTPPAS